MTAFVNESLQFNGPASNIWPALSNARWPLSVQADVARAETEEFVREIVYDYQIVKNACCDEYCIRASSGAVEATHGPHTSRGAVALAEQDDWRLEGLLALVALLPVVIGERIRRHRPELERLCRVYFP